MESCQINATNDGETLDAAAPANVIGRVASAAEAEVILPNINVENKAKPTDEPHLGHLQFIIA